MKISNKVRINEIRIGQMFKRSEKYSGTVTYKCLSHVRQSAAYRNEYDMRVEVIACTSKDGYYSNQIGCETIITSNLRYGKLGLVTLLEA